jgi:hypothetical protein
MTMTKSEPRFRAPYRGVNINRTTTPGYELPWNAYVAGRFVSADTLGGLKELISDRLSASGDNRD